MPASLVNGDIPNAAIMTCTFLAALSPTQANPSDDGNLLSDLGRPPDQIMQKRA